MVKKSLILFLTNNCNLNCKYCFVKKEQHQSKLDFTKYKEVIDNNNKQISSITFFGGEPLLYIDLIESIIKYNKEKKYHFQYILNTNAILLNDKIIEFIKKNNILVNASLDGNSISNSYNRFDEILFKKVINNIYKLKQKDIEIIINYVITPNNIDYLYDSLHYFKENSLKKIALLFDYDAIWQEKDLKKLKNQLENSMDIFSDLSNKDFIVYPIYSKILAILENKEIPKCRFGEETIVMSRTGEIYPCISFVDDKAYQMIDFNHHLKNTVNISKCKKCKYLTLCTNNCMCRYKNNPNEIDINCEIEKILIDISSKIIDNWFKNK